MWTSSLVYRSQMQHKGHSISRSCKKSLLFFYEWFLNNSHGVWTYGQWRVKGSPSITWNLNIGNWQHVGKLLVCIRCHSLCLNLPGLRAWWHINKRKWKQEFITRNLPILCPGLSVRAGSKACSSPGSARADSKACLTRAPRSCEFRSSVAEVPWKEGCGRSIMDFLNVSMVQFRA